jgi:hypothetical protein
MMNELQEEDLDHVDLALWDQRRFMKELATMKDARGVKPTSEQG